MRTLIIWLLCRTGKMPLLYQRAVFTEIGHFSGHVSELDKAVAEDHDLHPLNRFERWLLRDIIKEEKAVRKDAFRETCLEVLGEDPDDWGRS